MWSVGCFFFTLLTGYAPFEEDTVMATILRIFKTCGTPRQDSDSGLLALCPDFIEKLGALP